MEIRLPPALKPTAEPIRLELQDEHPGDRADAVVQAIADGSVTPGDGKLVLDALTAAAALGMWPIWRPVLRRWRDGMANLSLTALGRRVDRLTIPTVDRPVMVVRFVGHGGHPAQPITQATCRDVVYSRDDKESEKAFLARIELQNPPTRQSGTVIMVH